MDDCLFKVIEEGPRDGAFGNRDVARFARKDEAIRYCEVCKDDHDNPLYVLQLFVTNEVVYPTVPVQGDSP